MRPGILRLLQTLYIIRRWCWLWRLRLKVPLRCRHRHIRTRRRYLHALHHLLLLLRIHALLHRKPRHRHAASHRVVRRHIHLRRHGARDTRTVGGIRVRRLKIRHYSLIQRQQQNRFGIRNRCHDTIDVQRGQNKSTTKEQRVLQSSELGRCGFIARTPVPLQSLRGEDTTHRTRRGSNEHYTHSCRSEGKMECNQRTDA